MSGVILFICYLRSFILLFVRAVASRQARTLASKHVSLQASTQARELAGKHAST